MDTLVPILSLKPDQYNQGRPIGSFFVMTFVRRMALPIGTVPVIGHGPTYGWVNSEKSVSDGHIQSDQKALRNLSSIEDSGCTLFSLCPMPTCLEAMS